MEAPLTTMCTFPRPKPVSHFLGLWAACLLIGSTPLLSAPVVSGVLNGASFTQTIAPGAIISIFGTALARGTASASSLPLPTSLEGTSVMVGGQPIPLFFVSTTQINAQLPF